MFKIGQQAPLAGAGAVSNPTVNGGTLSLGGDGQTALTVTDTATYAMTASGAEYQVVNRRNGAVLMLCDPLGAGDAPGTKPSRYVAIATASANAETQATKITDVSELANKTLYEMLWCSYADNNFTTVGQNATTPNAATLTYTFDATGNLTGSNGVLTQTATQVQALLNGSPLSLNGRTVWFDAYKFVVGGQSKIYFAIRNEPANGDEGFAVLWSD